MNTPKTNPTAIITGASSGIGLGLAKGFLAAGYNVIANSRHINTAGTLQPAPNLTLIEGDAADPATARTLIQSAITQYGRLDLVINNAGIFVPKPFTDYTPEDFHRVLSTNTLSFFYLSQEAVRQMLPQHNGHILSISTTLAQQPVAGVNAALTSITKGGLNAVTRELAIEYAPHGIRFNAIAPGIIDTPMHNPQHHDALKQLHPIRRLGTVQEIVDAALFLDRATFITGELLNVDGGAHAGKW